MNYYFWVKETDKHDKELAVIEADNLQQAKDEFANHHQEDIKNIESISEEDSFLPIEQYS